MNIADMIRVWVFVLVSTSAWSNVLVHWTSSALPPAKELGLKDLVLSWNGSVSPLAKAARRQGYRVYVQVPLNQATAAADSGAISPEGIILSVRQSERAELEKSLPKLRSAHPKLRFVVLNPDGKRPRDARQYGDQARRCTRGVESHRPTLDRYEPRSRQD